jgi:hypothetical protein
MESQKTYRTAQSSDRPRRRQRLRKNACFKDIRAVAFVDKGKQSLVFPDRSIFLLCCECLEKSLGVEFYGEVNEPEDFTVDDPDD